MYSFFEIPYLLLGGVLVGCLAAGYIQLVQFFARMTETPFWMRMILAGVLPAHACTGCMSMGPPWPAW